MDKNTTDNQQQFEEQLQRAQRELAVLYNISNALRTSLELNHILYIILTGVTAHSGLGFNRGVLFLPGRDKRSLECKMVIGPESGERAQEIWNYIEKENPQLEDLISTRKVAEITHQSSLYRSLRNIQIPLNAETGGLLAEVYHLGAPIHLKSEQIATYQDDPFLKIFHSQELVVMPLRAKEEVKGLIVADNIYTKRPFTKDDLRIFRMLADQAALAIENSLLYEMMVHRSHTDSLTNVWNHGFFQQTLTDEVEKAKKNTEPLSLAMIDIDDFKKLNDTLGHQKGDIVLKEMADIMKKICREIDYVCRYGGEEFALILTQANRDNAYAIAERIRESIAQHDFSRVNAPSKLDLTVSIGVATLPDDATSKEELITRADRAMYIAKFSGKNRTCLADESRT